MNDSGEAALQKSAVTPAKPRSRLVRKYALLISFLVAGVLIVSGVVETYFSYQETTFALQRIQREKANSAAAVIDRFVKEVEAQMGWTTHASFLAPKQALVQRRFDFLRLLRQAPEITEIAYVDGSGREQLLVSRLSIDVVGSGKDYTNNPKFRTARSNGRYFSPVYFRRESEPYLSLGLRGQRREKGITIAEVNLKFVWDLISQMDVGRAGSAFVVDSNGLLIAHRDISLVLRKTDLSALPQVVAARAAARAGATGVAGGVARGLGGREVLSSHAAIAPLGWLVFVESPLSEAFAPLYDSLIRTAVLLAAGFVLSIFAGILLARRIVRPIQALQLGASRIAAGELDHAIDVATGDELEDLAEQFNDMAGELQTSYATLERNVEERTRALNEAMEQLRALGEVGQVVNSSLDLTQVLETIVAHAVDLSDTDAGTIYDIDEATGEFRLQATYGLSDEFVEALKEINNHEDASIVRRATREHIPIAIADMREQSDNPRSELMEQSGYRAHLAVPLLRENEAVGALVVQRKQPGQFDKDAIDLLQNFATQSVLPIQNARLYQDIEEKGRQIEIESQHKSQFLANMSHELRTPLNAILGYTELILDEIYGPPNDKVREVLERVNANGRHLLGLINEVLDLSKIEAGELELEVTDFSMTDVVHTVVTATESLAAAKNLALNFTLPSSLPTATGDQRRIVQVLFNLVGNAIKFTDEGGVDIRVAADNGMFDVQVADTGPGIAPDDQVRIFQEFQQVDNTTTKEKGGTGLGLAIAKRIVEMHGGRIWIESIVGEGSTFRFSLPLDVNQTQVPS